MSLLVIMVWCWCGFAGAEEEVFCASCKDRLPSKGSAPSPSVEECFGVLRIHVSKILVFSDVGLILEGRIHTSGSLPPCSASLL